jgi:hypothetical protein
VLFPLPCLRMRNPTAQPTCPLMRPNSLRKVKQAPTSVELGSTRHLNAKMHIASIHTRSEPSDADTLPWLLLK